MLRRMFAILVVGFMAMVACGVTPVSDESIDQQENEQSQSAIDQAIAANCSIVQFCNAPGSDGTVCRQQSGCLVTTAVSECKVETSNVCGSPVPIWIFVTRDGARHSAASSCILSNRCGGQAPSGCHCDTICHELGDCCFDGPC
jgi:hypothetical protein